MLLIPVFEIFEKKKRCILCNAIYIKLIKSFKRFFTPMEKWRNWERNNENGRHQLLKPDRLGSISE